MTQSEHPGPQDKGRSPFGVALSVFGIVASVLFLLNLTMGIVEVPDNAPFIGHIDEALAAAVLLSSLRYLGLDILPFLDRVSRTRRKR